MNKRLITALLLFCATSVNAADLKGTGVQLRFLDKITGRSIVKDVPIDTEVKYEDLSVFPISCYSKPPEEAPENAAFLEIYETARNKDEKQLFKGWMFSSSPAISALEHPVYDVWVIKCLDVEPAEEPQTEAEQPKIEIIRKDRNENINLNFESPSEGTSQGEETPWQNIH